MDWTALKHSFVDWAQIDHDILHVYVGVAVQLSVALLLRKSLASMLPLIVLIALEATNEWYDIRHVGGLSEMNPVLWQGTWYDVGNTLLLPVVFFCVSRFLPSLLVDQARLASPSAPQHE